MSKNVILNTALLLPHGIIFNIKNFKQHVCASIFFIFNINFKSYEKSVKLFL